MCAWFSSFLLNALVSRVNLPHCHPHREVRALDVGRADVPRIGIAGDLILARPDAF